MYDPCSQEIIPNADSPIDNPFVTCAQGASPVSSVSLRIHQSLSPGLRRSEIRGLGFKPSRYIEVHRHIKEKDHGSANPVGQLQAEHGKHTARKKGEKDDVRGVVLASTMGRQHQLEGGVSYALGKAGKGQQGEERREASVLDQVAEVPEAEDHRVDRPGTDQTDGVEEEKEIPSAG